MSPIQMVRTAPKKQPTLYAATEIPGEQSATAFAKLTAFITLNDRTVIDLVLVEMLCYFGFLASIDLWECFAEGGQIQKTTHNSLIITEEQEVQPSQDSDSEIELTAIKAIVTTTHTGVVSGRKDLGARDGVSRNECNEDISISSALRILYTAQILSSKRQDGSKTQAAS